MIISFGRIHNDCSCIPAKGQSNRLPNKNMSIIHGHPMIYYTIKYAKEARLLTIFMYPQIVKIIKNYCLNLDVEYIKRPLNLCGETPIIDVYRHAYNEIKSKQKIQIMVGLQPDHPDRF